MTSISQSTDTVNRWAQFKRQSMRIAKHMKLAAGLNKKLQRRYERMSQCGHTISYTVDNDGQYHYAGAWLCRDRLCPICAWRLSIKRTAEMIKVLNLLADRYPNTKAIHIVLTVRNCSAEELRSVLQQLSAGFTRMKKLALWKDYILGYGRSVEITYNTDTDSYHPHIHVFAIVNKEYTRQISMGDWVDMWRNSVRIDYNPIVWAQSAYNKSVGIDFAFESETNKLDEGAAKAAIIEACKYAIKPQALSEAATEGDIGSIAEALNGLRLISFGGIIKKLRAELKMNDKDQPEEQLPQCVINPTEALDQYTVIYEWCYRTRQYVIVNRTDVPKVS